MGVLPANPQPSADSKEETWPRLRAHKTAGERPTFGKVLPELDCPKVQVEVLVRQVGVVR